MPMRVLCVVFSSGHGIDRTFSCRCRPVVGVLCVRCMDELRQRTDAAAAAAAAPPLPRRATYESCARGALLVGMLDIFCPVTFPLFRNCFT